jgi:hypothetical protein
MKEVSLVNVVLFQETKRQTPIIPRLITLTHIVNRLITLTHIVILLITLTHKVIPLLITLTQMLLRLRRP